MVEIRLERGERKEMVQSQQSCVLYIMFGKFHKAARTPHNVMAGFSAISTGNACLSYICKSSTSSIGQSRILVVDLEATSI